MTYLFSLTFAKENTQVDPNFLFVPTMAAHHAEKNVYDEETVHVLLPNHQNYSNWNVSNENVGVENQKKSWSEIFLAGLFDVMRFYVWTYDLV